MFGLERHDVLAEILAIGFAAASMFLRKIFKGMALDGRVKQRTTTFLRLDKKDFRKWNKIKILMQKRRQRWEYCGYKIPNCTEN